MNQEEGGIAISSELPIGLDEPLGYPVQRPPSLFAGEAADKRADKRPEEAADAAASRIEVRIGHGLGGLLALESAWRELLATLPRAFFIHSFEWQRAYLECLESDPEATRYVSLFDRGRAVAIFPLRYVRRRVGGIVMWMWELPTHPHLLLGDPLLSPEWDSAVLVRLLIRALDRAPAQPWHALRLPTLPDDAIAVRGDLCTRLPRTHQERAGSSMYFDCKELDVALANCSGGFVRNLRRQARKLAQRGTVTLTMARHGAELDAAFADFLRLEASGWKGAAGKVSAIALHPRLLSFYLALKDRFSASDACLVTLLRIDDKVVAAQFCLQSGDTIHLLKIAYDENWRTEAPGNQLLYRLLEYCCDDPAIRRLSLVSGPSWAVGRWNPECQDVWRLHVFKRSLRGAAGLTLCRCKGLLWTPAKARWEEFRSRRVARGQPRAQQAAAG